MTNKKNPAAPTPVQAPIPAPAAAGAPKIKKTRLEIAREKAAQAAAFLQKLEAQAQAKASGENRKLETRRKVLLGAYLLDRIKKNDEVKTQVLKDLDKYLTRAAERALFDLPPLPEPPPAAEPLQGNEPS